MALDFAQDQQLDKLKTIVDIQTRNLMQNDQPEYQKDEIKANSNNN